MPAQALYLKWRPSTFDDVIGQSHITRTLRNALIQDRVRHAYLFNGPRGTGKTTMARIMAKAVNCLADDAAARPCDTCRNCTAINEGRFLDLIEIDAASHNGVDDVRDLRDRIAFAPSEGRYKVYIIDEVHRFSGAAFDALLKTLEEPPDHAIFVLATTELDKVPATIRSRSLTFEFRRVSIRDVADRLEQIALEEGVQIERGALELVASQGTGSVRDSISLLDQLIADPTEMITLAYAERALGTAGSRTVGKLVQAIIDNAAADGLDLLNRAIDDGADPGQLGKQIVEYLRNLLLVQTGGPNLVDVSDDLRAVLRDQAAATSRDALLRALRRFNEALTEVRTGWQPQLPLELALIESTRPLPAASAVPAADYPAQAAPTRPSAQPAVPESRPAPSSPEKADKGGKPEKATKAEKSENKPATPASITEAPTLKVSDIRGRWPEFLIAMRAVPANRALAGLLEHATPYNVEGNTLVLAASNSVFQAKIEDRRNDVLRVLRETLKREVGLRVVVANTETGKPVDATIEDDPLIGGELQSGAKVTYIDKPDGG